MKRSIVLGVSPNTERDDAFLALRTLFSLSVFKNKNAVLQLEQRMKHFFHVDYISLFTSARGALYATLKSLDIGNGDEVILQAFTCSVIADAILATGAKPIYVDINPELTINVKDVKGKITENTKAIIAQHTFGIPADIPSLVKIIQDKDIKLIEDCAHVLGAEINGKKLGLLGDVAVFSFARDKAFSCTFGGMVITKDKTLGEKIRLYRKQRNFPPFLWTAQQLLHPILCYFLILPFYDFFSLGKLLLVISQKLNVLSKSITSPEKNGKLSEYSIKKMPGGLALLVLHQMKKKERYNKKREEMTKAYIDICQENSVPLIYAKLSPLLRFPLLVENREEMKKYFKTKSKIYLGDWYSNVIDPKDAKLRMLGYKSGSCTNAEDAAKNIINLPTYPILNKEQKKRILETFENYVESKRSKK